MGRREEVPNGLDCEQLKANVHAESMALFQSVQVPCFPSLSLSQFLPTLSSTMHAGCEHEGGA